MVNGLIAGIITCCGGFISWPNSPAAHNHGVVFIDPTPQIVPRFGIRPGKVEVTPPEPWAFFLVMLDQRQWLRVVHNDKVVIEKVANAVLVNHLLENFFFDAREINFSALKGVVHLLRDREKIRGPLNYSPFCAQSEAVHEQSERRNYFRNAAAVVGGIEICDVKALQSYRLLTNALNCLATNERLVIFDLYQAIMGHL
jgi:hypothetical protein